MMNEWEAKYKALAAGIDDPELIANAEKLVRAAITLSQTSVMPFGPTFEAMLRTVAVLREQPSFYDEFSEAALFSKVGSEAKIKGKARAGNAFNVSKP